MAGLGLARRDEAGRGAAWQGKGSTTKFRKENDDRWDELETALGIPRTENRFKTVQHGWRRKLKKERGIWTRGDLPEAVGIGFKVLTHDEQVSFAGNRYRQAGRRIVDGYGAAANADELKLSPESAKQRDHLILAGRHLHSALIESRRFIPKATIPPETMPSAKAPAQDR